MIGNGDIHSGHRQRMKERFLANGLEGFSQHEIIELILYYAIPRRDVNELSHRIIERFGSYKNVFDADYEDLLSVEGVGENAATLIKLMAASWRKYALYDEETPLLYDTLEKIGEYAVKLFIGVSVEKMYIMLFDNKMMLLDTVMLSEGSLNSVHVPPRTIVEKAIKKNAASIVIIHNHPSGTTYPSDDDTNYSRFLKNLLSSVGINMIDHIIVCGRFYRPVFEGEEGEKNFASPVKFSYGIKPDHTGIRVAEGYIAAASVPYKGNSRL